MEQLLPDAQLPTWERLFVLVESFSDIWTISFTVRYLEHAMTSMQREFHNGGLHGAPLARRLELMEKFVAALARLSPPVLAAYQRLFSDRFTNLILPFCLEFGPRSRSALNLQQSFQTIINKR